MPRGADDDRLERLQTLSNEIADAMAQMLAFQAKVNATLREIALTRAVSIPYPAVKSRGAVRCALCQRAIGKAATLVVRGSEPMHLRCYEQAARRRRKSGRRAA